MQDLEGSGTSVLYRTGVPLPSRCCILYIFFNKYKYGVL